VPLLDVDLDESLVLKLLPLLVEGLLPWDEL
jgi:hypothetical protein